MTKWMRRAALGAACSAILVLAPARGHAQVARLDGRVSETVRVQVRALADSLARGGIPDGPLVDKALEGTSKHASDQRIIAAVRAVATDLRTSQRALGTATADELATGAAALRAGVSPKQLTAMRKALGDRSLVVPLSVLSALVVQGVPAADAQVAVVAQAKGDDRRVLAFARDVRRAIDAGVSPTQVLAEGISLPSALTDPHKPPTTTTTQPTGVDPLSVVTKIKPKP